MKWLLAHIVRSLLLRARRSVAHSRFAVHRYRLWIKKYEIITAELRRLMAADIATWPSRPLISVIMPSYNIDPKWMTQAIESVLLQIYPHWQLCISDDASTLPGVRPLLERYAAENSRILVTFRSKNGHISVNSNTALTLAGGAYIALMDADDLLSEDALFWVAREIALHPDVDLLFSDEDKIDDSGKRFNPYFKSAWNPALMLSQNAFSHLGVYRRSLVEEVGGFRKGLEGSQDYDLVLRCAEKTAIDRIRHIPRVLYHWRALPGSTASTASAKSYAWAAGKAAIAGHLKRLCVSADVGPALTSYYQVNYAAPAELAAGQRDRTYDAGQSYRSQMPGFGIGKVKLPEFRTHSCRSLGSRSSRATRWRVRENYRPSSRAHSRIRRPTVQFFESQQFGCPLKRRQHPLFSQ